MHFMSVLCSKVRMIKGNSKIDIKSFFFTYNNIVSFPYLEGYPSLMEINNKNDNATYKKI